MPVFTSGQMGEWCEVEDFQIVQLGAGEERRLRVSTARMHVICTAGRVNLRHGASRVVLEVAGQYEAHGGEVRLQACGPAQILYATGHWTEVTSAGIFKTAPGAPPTGDSPYSYAKATPFDRHYHDCDEYWFFLEGRASAVCGDSFHEVGPGDCVATPMGWNHDLARCHSPSGIRAVWFESTLKGQRRAGHLWEPKHGQAVPKAI